jgi:hypothetical protein
VKREQFLSRLRKLCRKAGREMTVRTDIGKGSHIGVQVDDGTTIVKSGELTRNEIKTMLKQLGLPPDALD